MMTETKFEGEGGNTRRTSYVSLKGPKIVVSLRCNNAMHNT